MKHDRHVHFKMTQAEFDALEKAAKDSGAPIAEIIRRAVAAFLNPKPKGKS